MGHCTQLQLAVGTEPGKSLQPIQVMNDIQYLYLVPVGSGQWHCCSAACVTNASAAAAAVAAIYAVGLQRNLLRRPDPCHSSRLHSQRLGRVWLLRPCRL
jgi:hypothetical protein